ncbi:MAG: GIY-YIG nuclease family protein [Devosia sp.]|nr:GIY-YIG nuclease family protein [Devosia sp.]
MPEKRIVYVLQSESNPRRFYTGLTSDLDRRLASHNAGLSRHTSTGCPWRVVTMVTFSSETAAKAFESYLKSGSGRAFARQHFR